MAFILPILLFVVGLTLIVKGADWLTDGAASVARRFNIPSIVIGLTIVAFGTSMPEMVVSAISAFNGQTEMAIGNVVGSNIFNILAIMGATAMVCPVKCSKGNIRYDVPFCILASALLLFMANDDVFFKDATDGVISRMEGIILLILMVLFVGYTLHIAKQGKTAAKEGEDSATVMPVWKSILLILIGLAGLIFGGDWMVDGASRIAALLGVSQSIIALTIVAAGTSFPEFVTSIMAARKGDTDMAMGNVVGSNIFNIFFALGVAATISPLERGGITLLNFAVLLGGAILTWLFCRLGKRHLYVTRLEGAILFACAVAYYTYAVLTAS